MQVAIDPPARSGLPEALALLVLALHGSVTLAHQATALWQWLAVGAVTIFAMVRFLTGLPRALYAFSAMLVVTWILMLSTGGTASLFLAWLFILALFYPAQIANRASPYLPALIGVAYLSLGIVSDAGPPPAIVGSRALLLAVVGWSVGDLALRRRRATERERERLRQFQASERRYQTLTETVPGITYVAGPTNDVLYMSPQVHDLLGYSPADFVERSSLWRELLHPDDRDRLSADLLGSDEHDTVSTEYRIRAKDGRLLWLRDEARVIADPASGARQFQGLRFDITPWKEAEATLTYQASLLDSMFDAVISTDASFRIVSWNPAAERIYGLSADEVVGKLLAEVIPTRYLDEVREEASTALFARGAWNGEVVQTGRAGPRDILSSVSLVRDAGGGVIGAVAVNRDVTEQKRTERALVDTEAFYRALIEKSLEGVIVFSGDGVVRYQSRSTTSVIGHPPEEVVGFDRSDLLHPDDLDHFNAAWRGLPPDRSTTVEYRVRSRDGGWRWLEGILTNLSQTPAVAGYVLNFRDVTESRLAEQSVRTLSYRLMTVREEQQRRLARELHDELGQTLTALNFNLQTLLRQPDEAVVRDSLSVVEGVISQVRELALNLHPTVLEDLGLTAALRWHALQQGKRAGLEVLFDIDIGPTRLATEIETSLYRIAQEALTNIVRHADARSVTFSLCRDEGEVVLTIDDDGRGFDATLAPDGASRTLGLLGMRERAELHGGALSVTSTPHVGTTIRATIPLEGG